MGTARSVRTPAPDAADHCDEVAMFDQDLAWLLHKAGNRMRVELDRLAAEAGLGDARDWIVLAALAEGVKCPQLRLSQILGLDKTTLIVVLDRLEDRGLIVRTADPADRRVRIPQITAAGRRMRAKYAPARDAAESRVLGAIDARQRGVLVGLLSRMTDSGQTH